MGLDTVAVGSFEGEGGGEITLLEIGHAHACTLQEVVYVFLL